MIEALIAEIARVKDGSDFMEKPACRDTSATLKMYSRLVPGAARGAAEIMGRAFARPPADEPGGDSSRRARRPGVRGWRSGILGRPFGTVTQVVELG